MDSATTSPELHRYVWDGRPVQGRWDGPYKDDERGPLPVVDYGWIGQDRDGVYVAEPPLEALAVRSPDLGDVVHRFWLGEREINPGDYDRLSARELDAKVLLLLAHHRELERDRLRRAASGNQT